MTRFALRALFFYLEAHPSLHHLGTRPPTLGSVLFVNMDVTGGHEHVPKLRVLTRVSFSLRSYPTLLSPPEN